MAGADGAPEGYRAYLSAVGAERVDVLERGGDDAEAEQSVRISEQASDANGVWRPDRGRGTGARRYPPATPSRSSTPRPPNRPGPSRMVGEPCEPNLPGPKLDGSEAQGV